MIKLLNRIDIEKMIDIYYLNGEKSDIINSYIDEFLCWQIMESDENIIFLHDVLQANDETIGTMIIDLSYNHCNGFCGIFGNNSSIAEEFETLTEFHYYFKSQIEVARKVVTWDFDCMFGKNKSDMREELKEYNCNSLFEYACKNLDLYFTDNGFVEKIYY